MAQNDFLTNGLGLKLQRKMHEFKQFLNANYKIFYSKILVRFPASAMSQISDKLPTATKPK